MSASDAAGRAEPAASDAVLARIVREENGRLVAVLTAAMGSLDVAEEAVAHAVEDALMHWRVHGVPQRPAAWLLTAARRDALDRVRRDRRYEQKLATIGAVDVTSIERSETHAGGSDERLPLLFGCCHPALADDAQLALTLRAVVGLTTAQIARVTLTTPSTVAQRIVRAKRKIGSSGIPLRIPAVAELPTRLDTVLAVVAAMYSHAHLLPGRGSRADRDLAEDAIWLARVVAAALPAEPEPQGLLALLLLHRARENARSVDDDLVVLATQDRTRWDGEMIARARGILERAARARRPGRWQLHAAIAACHADAATAQETDWLQILTLYDVLRTYDASAIVSLNRAVALGYVHGAQPALAEVEALSDRLAQYFLWHAVRAYLLRSAGRRSEADAADLRAVELTANDAERRLLTSRVRPQRD